MKNIEYKIISDFHWYENKWCTDNIICFYSKTLSGAIKIKMELDTIYNKINDVQDIIEKYDLCGGYLCSNAKIYKIETEDITNIANILEINETRNDKLNRILEGNE